MRKINDPGMFENRVLADTELDLVTGGEGSLTDVIVLGGLVQMFGAMFNSISAAASDAAHRA